MISIRLEAAYLRPEKALFRRDPREPDDVFANGFPAHGPIPPVDEDFPGVEGDDDFVLFHTAIEVALLGTPAPGCPQVAQDSKSRTVVEHLYEGHHRHGLHVDITRHRNGLRSLPPERRGLLLFDEGFPAAHVLRAFPMLITLRLDEYGRYRVHGTRFLPPVENPGFEFRAEMDALNEGTRQ
ncbi:hypothetical protein GCM10022243_04660 [Saccharothrix violaceirubra]|uniref:Uncharacterized protein n=1 Tax=Saccharothrix violaceirubra TaxID=413306 RepID=A0A7W7SXP4_9PSEU|nr:hypothetical protein [Saccharothrix violaceirubra]MBB4962875.1 hypothetical protein [Saccharothrix violaceirubra]